MNFFESEAAKHVPWKYVCLTTHAQELAERSWLRPFTVYRRLADTQSLSGKVSRSHADNKIAPATNYCRPVRRHFCRPCGRYFSNSWASCYILREIAITRTANNIFYGEIHIKIRRN